MNKYIGDKNFYRKTLAIAVPIMIQNGLTNFVGLLDNIMVGKIGTEKMTGIAIVNQLLFVFSLAIFGAVAGAGIYAAQFYGKNDQEGVRNSFRFKFIVCVLICIVGITVLSLYGENLIELFLRGEAKDIDPELVLKYGKQYMMVMFIGLVPFALEQAYTGTLRECGETVVSMKAGAIAILVNLVLNYLLIFGKFGFPELGVVGAAIATVISRYIQFSIIVYWTHSHSERMPFIRGVYRSFRIPAELVKKISIKGAPLFVNEVMWASGMALLNQSYSVKSLNAVAALNISSTITNVLNVVFIALGDAVAIIVGQQLGAGEFDEAKDTDRKLIAFSGFACVILGIILFIIAPIFPQFYDTTDEIKELATSFMRIACFFIPVWGLTHAIYFTLRSGGKTLITFFFDSVFMIGVVYSTSFVLSRYTDIKILDMYLVIQSLDIIKVVIGFILVKKGVWINNIVEEEK